MGGGLPGQPTRFTEETRNEYRRDLKRVLPFFERRGRSVVGVSPADIDALVAWLCDEQAQGRKLADASVRRILCPLRACLATARRHQLIRANPVDGAKIPHRPGIRESERIRVLSREQLDGLIRAVDPTTG